VSLTSTFDRKLKSLLSATTAAAAVEAVTDTTPATETKASNVLQEHSKLPQEHEIEEISGDYESLPVRAGGSTEMSKNNLLETSAVSCTSDEYISVQPAVTFTTTCTALFRDPSLHRRKSTPVDYQGQKDVSWLILLKKISGIKV
jgi:hypothetical protein